MRHHALTAHAYGNHASGAMSHAQGITRRAELSKHGTAIRPVRLIHQGLEYIRLLVVIFAYVGHCDHPVRCIVITEVGDQSRSEATYPRPFMLTL